MEKDKEIDNLFKKGLENPDGHSAYMDDDWGDMERLLDENKKRPAILYWLPVLGGIAALLLLAIGWWWLQPGAKPQHNEQQAAVQHKVNEAGKAANQGHNAKSTDTIQPAIAATQNAPVIANNARSVNKANGVKIASRPDQNGQPASSPVIAVHNTAVRPGPINPQAMPGTDNALNDSQLIAFSQSAGIETTQPDGTIYPVNVLSKPGVVAAANKPKVKVLPPARPQFAISALASSDRNGINSFQQGKPGTNAGLLFSMSFKKFTISTGAVYSSKQYATDFASYHTSYQFPSTPTSVSADCKMLDIPLNIDYQIFKNYRNKISVGSGFSSYLMLHENYYFNYAGYAKGPAGHDVANPGNYLFSIVNLQATYTRQINSKLGLSIQPYMKLPISNIGFSQVRLQSTGVAVGLSWNLNSSSNP